MSVEIKDWTSHLEFVELGFFRLPENQGTDISADAAQQSSITFEYQTPDDAARDFGRLMRANLFARFPVKDQYQRFLNARKWIGCFVESAAGELRSIIASRHAANTTVINLLSTVVRMQWLGVD